MPDGEKGTHSGECWEFIEVKEWLQKAGSDEGSTMAVNSGLGSVEKMGSDKEKRVGE